MPEHSGHLLKMEEYKDYAASYKRKYISQSNPMVDELFWDYGEYGRGWAIYSSSEILPANRNRGNNIPYANLPTFLAISIWKRTN